MSSAELKIPYIEGLPSSWNQIPNRYLFTENKNKVGENFGDYQLLSLTTRGVREKDIDSGGGKVPDSYEKYLIIKKNQIIFCLFDLDVSAVFSGISKFDGMITSAYNAYCPTKLIIGKYADYWFQYVFTNRYYMMYSKNIRYSITGEMFKSIYTPVPPISVQEKIVTILEYKVDSIDLLILNQKQQINKLKDYKQTKIEELVKGYVFDCSSDNCLIDSTIYPLNKISTIVRGNSNFKKDELLNEGAYVGLQYGKTYKVDVIDEDYQFFVSDVFYKETQLVNKNDVILISTSETIEDLGHSCFYNKNEIGLLGGEQFLLKPNMELIEGKFLYYLSKVFGSKLKIYATGLKVYRYNESHLKKIFIRLPSISVQREYVETLDKIMTAIDKLVEIKISKLEKLAEYKKSLIYEYVTGKKEV